MNHESDFPAEVAAAPGDATRLARLRAFIAASPWVTISVLLHVLVLTLLTVVVLHEQPAEGANGPPQVIALAPPTFERIDPASDPLPPLSDRTAPDLSTLPPPDPDGNYIPDALPVRLGEFSPDSTDDTAPPGPINWDPDALATLPNTSKGGSSIGVNGPGHYGFTDAFEGRGKQRGKGGGLADPRGGGPPDKKRDPLTVSTNAALQWLSNHQSPDGRWDCDGFDAQCRKSKCDGRGEATYDVGVTGLALLCFLGAGYTHQVGPYKRTVRDGLLYLKSVQDEDGVFGGKLCPHYQYNHACAALAMAEAYGMTGANAFKEPARKGVAWVGRSQNPYRAWRYGCADGDNDSSVTGWMTMVLKSAAMAGIDIEHQSLDHAAAYVEEMTEENGRTGYQQKGGWPARVIGPAMEKFPAQNSESLTAVGMLVRIFDGRSLGADPSIGKGADLLVAQLPKWDAPSIDFYYWYYGTLAMFQVGGARWERWNAAMKTAIVDHQRLDPMADDFGSWDPVDPWSSEGGRVYATALNCLCTEVYYRYPRVFGGSTGAAKPK